MSESKVDHPPHYNQHPTGIECIDIIEAFPFNIGAAIKYLWRAEFKGNPVEDLEKAAWYVERELKRQQRSSEQSNPVGKIPYLTPAGAAEGAKTLAEWALDEVPPPPLQIIGICDRVLLWANHILRED